MRKWAVPIILAVLVLAAFALGSQVREQLGLSPYQTRRLRRGVSGRDLPVYVDGCFVRIRRESRRPSVRYLEISW